MKRFIFLSTVIIPALVFSSCSYIEPEDPQRSLVINDFDLAIEENNFAKAFSFLTKDAQSKVDYKQFSSTSGDYEGVIMAFRQAGITIRNKRLKDEPGVYVLKLKGNEGTVRFVMVQEGEEWKIANVIEDSLNT